MIKKIIAICLAATLLLLSGCGGNDEEQSSSSTPAADTQSETVNELQLLYCANDTMNPYKTISKLNAELAYLLFDPLIKVDNSFEEVLVLAKSAVTENKVCTVTLREAVFSDGTAVTADDVVYSYKLAKTSERFSSLFYETEKVEAADAKTVVFTLKVHDPYFSKLLTFPILKTGSDQLKNEDNVELVPIGCGKFVFDEAGTALIPNTKYYGSTENIAKINLVNAPDSESMQHYVEVGATNIYYAEMIDDTIIRMSGKKTEVNLNNLIYLGINHNFAPLKSAELRYAISSAVSRTAIATNAFYSNALPATGFFHPDWAEISGYQTIQSEANQKISVENLAKIGYNRQDNDGYYVNTKGKPLELTLLVNSDSTSKLAAARLIVEQLKAAGIKITLTEQSRDAYFAALKAGQFQLYLGEIKLLPNMDIRSLVLEGGSAAYGITGDINQTDEEDKKTEASDAASTESEDASDEEATADFDSETAYASVVKGFYEGKNSAVDVASALLASMPVIPLVYRSSIVFYSNEIEDVLSPSSCDIFLSIDKYKFKK